MVLSDNCEDLVINKNNFDHIFIAGSIWSNGVDYAALHKSLNGGASWTHKKLSTSKNSYAYAVAIHPSNDNIVYAGGSVADKPTVFKSTNGGSSWSKTTLIGGYYPVYALAVDPNTPSRIYAGTWQGIFWSANSGSSWTRRGGFGAVCLKINPNNPSIIYAGGIDGVYVSTDYGNTWNEFNDGLTIKDVQWLDIDKSHKILYAATAGGGVYKRTL
jgi:hypothetical protein